MNKQMTVMNSPVARLAIKKNVLPFYNGEVGNIFMKNGTEFQIELFNPLQKNILAKIYLNEALISNSGVVVRPGERVWLERFIDEDKKFKFETYSVNDTPEVRNAIKNNGKVRIEFFREKELLLDNWSISLPQITYYPPIPYTTQPYQPFNQPFYTSSSVNCFYNSDINLSEKSISKSMSSRSKETGRIEKGEKSNQKFQTVNLVFSEISFHTVEYQILPETEYPQFNIKKIRHKCSRCGTTVQATAKFCSECGLQL